MKYEMTQLNLEFLENFIFLIVVPFADGINKIGPQYFQRNE